MSHRRSTIVLTAMLSASPFMLTAQSATPMGSFVSAPAPGVTFGGAGIPGPVMQAQVFVQPTGALGPLLTLGASPRYDNAPLTTDGKGTYFAQAGADACTPLANPSCPAPGFARWNFNFAVIGENRDLFTYALYYSLTPLGASASPTLSGPVSGPFQGSLNLGMAFLDQDGVGGVSFSPTATGTYKFSLIATPTMNDLPPTEVAIAVVTTSTVPEPGTVALVGAGMLLLLGVGRRRRVVAG